MRCVDLLAKLQVLLVAVSLTAGMAILGAVKAGEAMQSGTYATAQVLETTVLFQDLKKASNDTQADVKQVYPMEGTTGIRFTDADWVLSHDGTAAMRVPSPMTNHPGSLTVSGSWGEHAGDFSIHLTGRGPRDLRITLDGLFEAQGGAVVFDGMWTASLRGIHQVERVRLRLVPTTNEAGWAAAALQAERTALAQRHEAIGNDRALSEPTAWIGGVPVPTGFDLTLDVILDGVTLPPMTGQLLLSAVQGTGEPRVAVTLTTTGAGVPGWSGWVSELAEPSVTVTAANGVLTIGIVPTSGFRNLFWYARNPEDPKGAAEVLAETGTITLKVTRDAVEGSIEANGTVMASTQPKSAFQAVIHGTRSAKSSHRSRRWHGGEANVRRRLDRCAPRRAYA